MAELWGRSPGGNWEFIERVHEDDIYSLRYEYEDDPNYSGWEFEIR